MKLAGCIQGCLGTVYPEQQEPDFCSADNLANYDCIFQGQNVVVPDEGFYMECRNKTGTICVNNGLIE
jgi:hypothetical protein